MSVLRIPLKNDLGEMKRINAALIDFLGEEGVRPEDINRVRLVVEELLVNIIKHAFNDDIRHTIVLTLRTGPEGVSVLTEDDGRPFDPREAPPPPLGRPLEEHGEGGYGIYIVKQMTTSLTYTRANGKNQVHAVVRRGGQEDVQ